MTRKEIIKALRCFASADNCPVDECNKKCPYWMENDKFDIENPNAEISDGHQLCRAAADMLEQDAKTKSQFSPIPAEEITGTRLVTPCWIEIKNGKGYTYITPDLLDKDSTGYFGRLYSHEGGTRQYLYEKDYNRTWRCWRDCPCEETVNNSKWEEAQ